MSATARLAEAKRLGSVRTRHAGHVLHRARHRRTAGGTGRIVQRRPAFPANPAPHMLDTIMPSAISPAAFTALSPRAAMNTGMSARAR